MNQRRGAVGFHEFYRGMWGERWEALRIALEEEPQKRELPNPFATQPQLNAIYELDPASVMAAEALEVQKNHRVLDLCAAPGGKSLVTIFSTLGEGEWVLNDLSRERIKRLKRVIHEYIPEEIKTRIKITQRDGSRWGLHEKNAYDRVLLDAPCSGERHLLLDKNELKNWSENRTKGLKQRQYALLCAGIQTLKPGGRLIYSTCSLSRIENDEVIERFMERKAGSANIVRLKFPLGEATTYGWQILPDIVPGSGPMYICALERVK